MCVMISGISLHYGHADCNSGSHVGIKTRSFACETNLFIQFHGHLSARTLHGVRGKAI